MRNRNAETSTVPGGGLFSLSDARRELEPKVRCTICRKKVRNLAAHVAAKHAKKANR